MLHYYTIAICTNQQSIYSGVSELIRVKAFISKCSYTCDDMLAQFVCSYSILSILLAVIDR